MRVGHGDYVAIIMPRSVLQIASVLAVSLLGGVFVPLDYEQPVARQKIFYGILIQKQYCLILKARNCKEIIQQI